MLNSNIFVVGVLNFGIRIDRIIDGYIVSSDLKPISVSKETKLVDNILQ